MTWLSLLLWLVFIPVAAGVTYLYLFVLAALRQRRTAPAESPHHRFAFLIAAHNEEAVIGTTVAHLQRLDYPRDLHDTYVVADHCSDATAERARAAGATCWERREPPQGSKAAALSWLLERVWMTGRLYDGLVILDADTQVDPLFLRYMATALEQGHRVVQGRHVIRNPQDGPYPALSWVMFTLDNRFQNLGRVNLGGSAKLMGDSVCFRSDILRRIGWQRTSLTEDYELRIRLLLEGVRIHYLPEAVGRGEAPLTWADARRQRARWLQGTHQARRHHAGRLLYEALRRCNWSLLDAALQMVLPAYSPLAVLTFLLWCAGLATVRWGGVASLVASSIALALLAAYPFLGLLLEKAPPWAYRALVFGPFFILWRTGLDLLVRLGWRKVAWVRTPRREEAGR